MRMLVMDLAAKTRMLVLDLSSGKEQRAQFVCVSAAPFSV
jgi:hypothetical protein